LRKQGLGSKRQAAEHLVIFLVEIMGKEYLMNIFYQKDQFLRISKPGSVTPLENIKIS